MAPVMALGLGGPYDILILSVIVLVVAVPTVFWIVEIVDVARRRFYDPNNKIIWLLVVILLHFLGAALYYFIGKKQGILTPKQEYT